MPLYVGLGVSLGSVAYEVLGAPLGGGCLCVEVSGWSWVCFSVTMLRRGAWLVGMGEMSSLPWSGFLMFDVGAADVGNCVPVGWAGWFGSVPVCRGYPSPWRQASGLPPWSCVVRGASLGVGVCGFGGAQL